MSNFNIYCDESCYLEHDNINVMVLGAVWCPYENTRVINERIREIKGRNGISPIAEMKWTKISPSKMQMFIDFVNYFFNEALLRFRAVIIPNKSRLDHIRFNQTHDDWYYKMYFEMLKHILTPEDCYNIYIDVKDTHTNRKVQKLREVCNNSMYDFNKNIVQKIQPIRSCEVQIMQIVDILIGALGYANRILPDMHTQSQAKLNIIDNIKKRSGYTLNKSTLLREDKFNLLIWDAR